MSAAVQVRFEEIVSLDGLTAEQVERTVLRAWQLFDGPPQARVEVVLLGEPQHTRLHEQFLDDPTPTDVMAFPYDDDDLFGEIVVNRDMALREAEQRGHAAIDEALLYVAHGALHLLGFRDDEEHARQRMRDAEQQVLHS